MCDRWFSVHHSSRLVSSPSLSLFRLLTSFVVILQFAFMRVDGATESFPFIAFKMLMFSTMIISIIRNKTNNWMNFRLNYMHNCIGQRVCKLFRLKLICSLHMILRWAIHVQNAKWMLYFYDKIINIFILRNDYDLKSSHNNNFMECF